MTAPDASQLAPSLQDVGLGVYIHIPFCISKCAYCAFSSITGGGRLIAPYLDALHREIDRFSDLGRGRRVASLYFGGGTPSLLSGPAIAGLIAHCRRVFAVDGDAEITLEANPETVTEARIDAYLAAGVTRISMGIQSLDSYELIELGRPHSPERAMIAYRTIRRAGCINVNVDLLYGLPGHTVEGWRKTLHYMLELEPEHLSAYALTPEPGTAIDAAVDQGRMELPPNDIIAQQEAVLADAVDRAGLYRYEISNYAKPGFACRHNLLYWHCGDWLGFGASAHSHLAGHRWWNHFEPDAYILGTEQGLSIAGREALDADQRAGEALAFGLRTIDGVSRSSFAHRFGVDPCEFRPQATRWLVEDGLLVVDAERLRLTNRGLALADTVATLLV